MERLDRRAQDRNEEAATRRRARILIAIAVLATIVLCWIAIRAIS